MRGILFFALFVLFASCDFKSGREEPKKTKEELFREELENTEELLKFNDERIYLLSIKNDLPYNKTFRTIRDYEVQKIDSYSYPSFNEKSPDIIPQLIDSIARVYSLTPKEVASLIYSYKYDECNSY